MIFTNSAKNKLEGSISKDGNFPIEIQRIEHIAIIRMKNGKNNPLNTEFIRNLYRTLMEAFIDDSVRVIILSSSLRFVFCTGLDLTENVGVIKRDKLTNSLMRQCQMFFALSNLIFNSRKPVIAAINGITIGLGVQIAAVCDYRISSEIAWFSIPEMKVGGVYPTIPLVEHIGLKHVKKMLYHGEKINSEEAYQIGLIDMMVAHGSVEEEAILYAKRIQVIDPLSLSLQRRLLNKEMLDRMRQEQREISLMQKGVLQREWVIDFIYRLKETGNIMNMN